MDAFLQAYRIHKGAPLAFLKASDIKPYECKAASRGVVKCGLSTNISDPRWMVHEFGHLLQHSRYADRNQGPYGALGDHEITDFSGVHVTGPNPNKGGIFERTMLGYLSDRIPEVYHGSGNYDDWNSNDDYTARNEDFADMFLNWVYDSFDKRSIANGAGIRRFEWIDQNIGTWIDNATY